MSKKIVSKKHRQATNTERKKEAISYSFCHNIYVFPLKYPCDDWLLCVIFYG